MKKAQTPLPLPRALLIPLDYREALLALSEFERPGCEAGSALPGEQGAGADTRAPKAA
ncbi:MAG: hypothetical protein ACYDC2_06920 [Solirubrobacteraceae bacterium]